MSNWIKVEDGLPESRGFAVVWVNGWIRATTAMYVDEQGGLDLGLGGEGFYQDDDDFEKLNATHWQILPTEPKENKQNEQS